MPSVSLNESSVSSAPPESQQQQQPGGAHYPPQPPPHQQQAPPPPPPQGHHQYPGGYPPYPRTGYEHPPPQHHVNNSDAMAVSQQHPYQHPYPPHQQPPMRFPGKPLPGGPPGSQQQQQPPPVSGQYPPQQMRSNYPPSGPGMSGQSISAQGGPTPTLNQLLQPAGAAGGAVTGPAGQGGAPPGMPGHVQHRYPPPPTGYDPNSYNMSPHSKSDYPAGPTGWPPPGPNQRPPVNSYGHGHPPPPFQQQAMYRQNAPPTGGRSSGGQPGPPPQHPGQYYQPPGMHHPPPHQQGFPPPPPQSPHYPPPHVAQRYPGSGSGMRPGENQPPSHYPPGPGPGMPPESSGLAPPGPPTSSSEGGHPPKSTPPPPQSPSLAQQQQMNHAQTNPPSPQASPRSTPVQSQHGPSPSSSTGGGIPPSSPSHRPQGPSPSSNSYAPPPDVGDVTGCNSNDSGPNAAGLRPSPSPTGSASSRSMSPAVGSQNIPMPPRPSSSQSEGSIPPRMSQSPMSGSYTGQQSMAPPPHHGYPPGGKGSHPSSGMIPPGHPPPPSPQHYSQQGQQHWQHSQHQAGQPSYGARPPHHGGMMSPYPPPPSQQPMPPNNYPPPRHPGPNHAGGPPPLPPQNQYSPYPPSQYGGPQPPPQQTPQPWASPTPPGPGVPLNPRSHHPSYLKPHLQQKMGFSPGPHGQVVYGPGGPMGPPQPSSISSSSPSQTPPPGPHQSHLPPTGQHLPPDSGDNSNSNSSSGVNNPPNIVSIGPDGAGVDEGSQQSTLSNTSGASGGDDGPAMPKLRKEGSVGHPNYPSHPTTPQSNAVPSPGAASMSSAHEGDYGEMNSPGWPRTPASPGLNSHPQPPSEQYKPKAKVKKKPDSLQKLYDMDDNPDRRGFLDKLMQFMDDHNTPITACPTISKNPLDLFRLYFLVKERGGFLEVTKNKTWKDIAGSLGIGASSSAAYTLRKHYTKHLLPFECKFDRGGIDPQPLINQVESTSKKKGAKVAPVPSPGSSNSQDSFQGANNNSNTSMDGFNSMPPSVGGSGGTPYGAHPPSEYNQSGGSTPTGGALSGSTNSSSSNSTPPLRPPTQSPVASTPPPQQTPGTPPQPPHPHSGEKTQISVSNPFDDLQHQHHHHHPPSSQYHLHHQYNQPQSKSNFQYAPFSGAPSAPLGYQGPPGSYPYSSADQYSGRQPHEAYNQQQPYGGPGYPPTGPGRPMYPYESTSSAGTPSQTGYPPSGPSPHLSQSPSQQPPTSVAGSTSSSSAGSDERYPMGPPPPAPGHPPPGSVNYPPHAGGPPHPGRMPQYSPTSGAPGHPPPNGYPSQDYYHSPPPSNEQGYTPISQQPPGAAKHMPPPLGSQRRMDYPPGKEPGSAPSASPTSQPYPGYPPQGQPPPPQRMPSYDGQGSKGGYMYPPPPGGSSSGSGVGGATGGRDHGSGTPNRSSPSPSPTVAAPNLQPAPHHANQSSSASTSLPPPPPTPHNTHNKPPWIPSEGWPGSSGQYPPQHQRGYPPGPPNAVPGGPPHGTPPPGQSPTPAQTPPSATPSQSTPPPSWPSSSPSSQAPSVTGNVRAPTGQILPPTSNASQWTHAPPPPDHSGSRYGPGASGPPPMSPQGPPATGNSPAAQQPPWTPPGQQGRNGQPRPPFPVPGKNIPSDMYNKYGSPGPSSSPVVVAAGPPPGAKVPAVMPPPNAAPMSPQPGGPTPPIGFPPVAPSAPAGLPLSTAQPPVPVKKEIVFPSDSVEAVTPVLSRRKKLHKSDVAPVEAWRIMMCLKSGLLAETTWALDVLNVLLYDDHSISYFSLTYLPGLLDILLEHLRRALILIFGNSIGIEMSGEKLGDDGKTCQQKQTKWYELEERINEDEPDVGTPRKKFPRDGHRTIVLQGSTNYTMVSRINKKSVGIVSKDDEPFVLPGPRDWDGEEKCRGAGGSAREPDISSQAGGGGLMELTRHVVTSFTADLNIVPVVRVLKPETANDRSRCRKRRRSSGCGAADEQLVPQIKREPQDCDQVEQEGSNDLNLELYQCETKLPNEIVPTSSSSSNTSGSSSANPSSSPSDKSKRSTTENIESKTEPPEKEPLGKNGVGKESSPDSKVENGAKSSPEKKNCQVLATSSFPLPFSRGISSGSSSSTFASEAQQNNRKLKRLDQMLHRIKHEMINGLSDEVTSMMDEESVVNGVMTGDNSGSLMVDGDGDNSNLSAANSCDEASCDESNGACTVKKCVRIGSILVQDHGSTLKRKKMEDFEDECYTRDEPSLHQVSETQDALARRCLSIFNILRNLTFVPGNDVEFGRSTPFLSLIGKLLLIHHDHPLKGKPTSKKMKLEGENTDPSTSSTPTETEGGDDDIQKDAEEEEEDEDGLLSSVKPGAAAADIDSDSCTSLNADNEWWWEYVHHLREHVLVMIANISGQMDLSQFSEEISRPILDGLLHWAVCPAAYGQDPFPTVGHNSALSPQRLAIEALCKLSVTQGNIDLLLATPPYSRIERLCQLLCRSLCPTEDQVMREFAINLLSYLSAADSGVARTIALQNPCISLLISFIEQAEVNANNINMNHGFHVLRDNPEAMGTSLDMLRRAATTLFNLAKHPDNRALFVQHEPRLLSLVMSHILEQKVAAIVAQVLFQCSAPESSTKYMIHCGSNYDTFYSIARSRSVLTRNKH